MGKSKSFGSASVKLLSSFAALFVVGCASNVQDDGLSDTYNELINQRSLCFEQASEGSRFFPSSDWLKTLDNKEKLQVISYLSQHAFNQCLQPKAELFEKELSTEPLRIQKFIKDQVPIYPYMAQQPDGIDPVKLEELKANISRPFIASEVYDLIK